MYEDEDLVLLQIQAHLTAMIRILPTEMAEVDIESLKLALLVIGTALNLRVYAQSLEAMAYL